MLRALCALSVLAAVVVGVFVFAPVLSGLWALAFLVAIWLGVEVGPELLATLIARRRERSGAPPNPLLFRDPEAEHRARMEKHFEDTSGNPTLR